MALVAHLSSLSCLSTKQIQTKTDCIVKLRQLVSASQGMLSYMCAVKKCDRTNVQTAVVCLSVWNSK
jgi:hypothetical protein